jgi:NDP-sugar pyrophosphorylase family protein
MATDIQLIVPMSGLGSRFVADGYVDPKPCIKVDGEPMIKRVLTLFPGLSSIHFVCNSFHLSGSNMRETLESVCPMGVIHEIPAGRRLGPVDAVLQIKDSIHDDLPTIVSYCDFGGLWDFQSFKAFVNREQCDGCVVCYTGFHPHMLVNDNYAYVKVENGLICAVREKSSFTDQRMSELASNGIYFFKSGRILKKYFKKQIESSISVNGEFYCSSTYQNMIDDGLRVKPYEIEVMLQWGTPLDLKIYQYWSDYFGQFPKGGLPSSAPLDATLLLPMAGKGSRFSREGYTLPKPLLEVNSGPMFIQAVRCLPQTTSILFAALDDHTMEFDLESIAGEWFESPQIFKLKETTDGQATTCAVALKAVSHDLDRPLLISACDNGVHYDHDAHQALVEDESVDVIVWSFRNNPTSLNNPHMYSWLDVDESGRISKVNCKRFLHDNPMSHHAIIGTMYFRKARYFQEGYEENRRRKYKTNDEYYVDDVINRCIETGLVVKVFEVKHYVCWGTPNDYKAFLYWQTFFDHCDWHPYKKALDPMTPRPEGVLEGKS